MLRMGKQGGSTGKRRDKVQTGTVVNSGGKEWVSKTRYVTERPKKKGVKSAQRKDYR